MNNVGDTNFRKIVGLCLEASYLCKLKWSWLQIGGIAGSSNPWATNIVQEFHSSGIILVL